MLGLFPTIQNPLVEIHDLIRKKGIISVAEKFEQRWFLQQGQFEDRHIEH